MIKVKLKKKSPTESPAHPKISKRKKFFRHNEIFQEEQKIYREIGKETINVK